MKCELFLRRQRKRKGEMVMTEGLGSQNDQNSIFIRLCLQIRLTKKIHLNNVDVTTVCLQTKPIE